MAVEPVVADTTSNGTNGADTSDIAPSAKADMGVEADPPVTRCIVKLSEETINRIAAGEVRFIHAAHSKKLTSLILLCRLFSVLHQR